MDKITALQTLKRYLNNYNIQHSIDFDNGTVRCSVLYKNCKCTLDNVLESTIWFFDKELEVRVHFTEKVVCLCRKSRHITDLLWLLNYINARVWLNSGDGSLYEPRIIYTPRFYLTADEQSEVVMTTIIPYEQYDLATVETNDYITGFCPELLDKLSCSIIGILLGAVDLDSAKKDIEKNIL